MAEQTQTNSVTTRTLEDVLAEVKKIVEQERATNGTGSITVKDLRWTFDQESAQMNQAIYNNWTDRIHESCLKTVRVLVEMLARS